MSAARKTVQAQFPAKLEFLFKPARYKVAYGGRGSGKSWSFARALLIQGAQRPLRVLCAREVQKSIRDSVHRLLSDQIESLQLGGVYQVLEQEIRGINGTLFSFRGLATETADSLKSFEGANICWVEEAHAVSKRSWDILVPTIRATGSEIWVSFNPSLETDETYKRFVTNPQPDSIVAHVNYNDNPWFPAVLEQERRECEKRDPESYGNIWGGLCKPAVEGAIYYKQVAQFEAEGRVRLVPVDPLLKTHAIWDLGWNDCTSIILAQRQTSELRIVGYIEDSHRTVAEYGQDLFAMRLNFGKCWLPHDAYTKNLQTGKSVSEVLRGMGFKCDQVPNIDVEKGIQAARFLFSRSYIDRSAARLVECLKRYRRQVNQATNEPGAPLHDEYSHGADAWRYLGLVVDKLDNSNGNDKPLKYDNRGIV